MRAYGWFVVGLVMAVSTGIGVASASPQMVKQAKDAGLPAQNCQYCHTDKMPKKDTFKPDELNERGKWLHAEAQKRNAKTSDGGWLKEYPGKKD